MQELCQAIIELWAITLHSRFSKNGCPSKNKYVKYAQLEIILDSWQIIITLSCVVWIIWHTVRKWQGVIGKCNVWNSVTWQY